MSIQVILIPCYFVQAESYFRVFSLCELVSIALAVYWMVARWWQSMVARRHTLIKLYIFLSSIWDLSLLVKASNCSLLTNMQVMKNSISNGCNETQKCSLKSFSSMFISWVLLPSCIASECRDNFNCYTVAVFLCHLTLKFQMFSNLVKLLYYPDFFYVV